jgi:hypothetical protein
MSLAAEPGVELRGRIRALITGKLIDGEGFDL